MATQRRSQAAESGRSTREDDEAASIRVDFDHSSRSKLRPRPSMDTSAANVRNLATPEDWLGLHAIELVDRLQAWASDLDAREAQLNARSALQDHRERSFRLHQQDLATELAEQKRSIDRLRRQLEAQARRLVFQDDAGRR